jgi:integrase
MESAVRGTLIVYEGFHLKGAGQFTRRRPLRDPAPAIQRPAALCKNEECNADIKEVKSPLAGLRFHDLRRQPITELAEKGVPEQTLMGIAGHVSRRMLDHYSHARLAAKRAALDALASQSASQNEKPAEASSPNDSFQMGPTGLEPMTSCV